MMTKRNHHGNTASCVSLLQLRGSVVHIFFLLHLLASTVCFVSSEDDFNEGKKNSPTVEPLKDNLQPQCWTRSSPPTPLKSPWSWYAAPGYCSSWLCSSLVSSPFTRLSQVVSSVQNMWWNIEPNTLIWDLVGSGANQFSCRRTLRRHPCTFCTVVFSIICAMQNVPVCSWSWGFL